MLVLTKWEGSEQSGAKRDGSRKGCGRLGGRCGMHARVAGGGEYYRHRGLRRG